MSAPFRHNVNHGSTASGNVAGVWRVRLSARRRSESLVVTAPSQQVLPRAISLVFDGWSVSLEPGPSRDKERLLCGEFRTK